MIGYYIHHQGRGHLTRATSICARLAHPVTALTSLPIANQHPFDVVVELPRDDIGDAPLDTDAGGAFHWTPLHDNGLRERMQMIANWVVATNPEVVVVDVSVEVSTLLKLLGVPVIVMAMPGDRTDAPHDLVYRLADHVLAAWPRELYEPDWLRQHAAKTSYVGGISRFDGRLHQSGPQNPRTRLLVLGGEGGSSVDSTHVAQSARDHPQWDWTAAGVAGGSWVADPWDDIRNADVIVAHAGQSSIADVAAAARPAIVIPQQRPFDEQETTAATLARAEIAVVNAGWPQASDWQGLVDRALAIDVVRWRQWQTVGAAARAAGVISKVATHRPSPVIL